MPERHGITSTALEEKVWSGPWFKHKPNRRNGLCGRPKAVD